MWSSSKPEPKPIESPKIPAVAYLVHANEARADSEPIHVDYHRLIGCVGVLAGDQRKSHCRLRAVFVTGTTVAALKATGDARTSAVNSDGRSAAQDILRAQG